MTLGERILLLRGKISREKYAVMTNISKNTLVNYEKGDNSPPAEYLNIVLQYHDNINPTWLLTGEGSMLKEESQVNTVTGAATQGIGIASGKKLVGISGGIISAPKYPADIIEIADLLDEHYSRADRKKLLQELLKKTKNG